MRPTNAKAVAERLHRGTRVDAVKAALRDLEEPLGIAKDNRGTPVAIVVPATHVLFSAVADLLGVDLSGDLEDIPAVRRFLCDEYFLLFGEAAKGIRYHADEVLAHFNAWAADRGEAELTRDRLLAALSALAVPVQSRQVSGIVQKVVALREFLLEGGTA